MSARILIYLLLGVTGPLAAQSPSRWCLYQVRSPDSIIAEHVEAVSRGDISVSAQQFPSRMTFRFTGATRLIPEGRRDFLQKYFTFLNRPGNDTLFQHELEMTGDSGRGYWFPIQETTLENFRAELAPGDSTTLFLLWAGAFGPKGGRKEWMFLINEFSSPRSSNHWAQELETCRP